MWPFGGNDDDGCGNHHFDEYSETDEVQVKERKFLWQDGQFKGWVYSEDGLRDEDHVVEAVIIQREKSKTCQHHGCDEEKTTWETKRVVPLDEVENVGLEREDFKKQYAPEDDDE